MRSSHYPYNNHIQRSDAVVTLSTCLDCGYTILARILIFSLKQLGKHWNYNALFVFKHICIIVVYDSTQDAMRFPSTPSYVAIAHAL